MLTTALPNLAMKISGHAGDAATGLTWPHRNVDAEHADDNTAK
jgi:hypothetical protein